MSYKALLFCGDEKTAQIVTQVLSELEFAVERAGEPFATVKKLASEHFDALVVDCQNEQDASLLFKGARESSNRTSLAVAVVEGQAGVAKAFRIGANLVLTKPINIEQSKGTLRVARGLLRKNEAKPAPGGTSPAIEAPGFDRKPPVFVAPVAPAPAAPFSSLELEEEPVPAAEPAEVAVLESLRDPIKPAAANEQTWAPSLKSSAEPIAASPAQGGTAAAAAPAPAPIRPVVEIKTAPPLASQEPVGAVERMPLSLSEVHQAPTFTAYPDVVQEPSSKKPLAIAAIFIVVCALGYAAWRKPQFLAKLHRPATTEAVQTPASAVTPSPVAASTVNVVNDLPQPSVPSTTESSLPVTSSKPPERMHDIETIQVEDPMENQASKITVSPKPLVVNTKTKPPEKPKVVQSTPPQPPSISADEGTDKLANLIATNAALPKPDPGSIRISQGVSQGLIVKRVAPVYPTIALQLRKQGTVELLAKIGKEGQIASLRVLSGDAVLAKSATDAVWQWKYRPYLLNGEPVEIETQITINFKTPQ